jgi:uncharacterized protein YgbK (DUF1537 family)
LVAAVGAPMIAAIADDLTGAAEIGGIGWRHGLSAEIVVGAEHLEPTPLARLIAIDSDSRSCDSEEAALRAAQAAAETKPKWIYKKVDSVLRGNVLAEIEAIRQTLGLKLALLVPANPSTGRTIRDGQYFIDGKPLAETDFARDPEYPRSRSDVLWLLDAQRSSRVRILKPGEPLPESGIVLGEVSSSADVEHWAARRSETMLCAGGGEFFTAILKATGEGRAPRPSGKETPAARELFVCGSASDYTRNFVSESASKGVPVFRLPRGPAIETRASLFAQTARESVASFSNHDRVILNIGLPLVEERSAARQLALDLVDIAARVLKSCAIGTVYVEGGATAVALVRQMQWQNLEVIREIAQGVVTMRPAGSTALLTMKPGSYPGWPAIGRDK